MCLTAMSEQHMVSLGCYRHFAWQAWQAWQAWHLRRWTGSGGAWVSEWSPWSPRLLAWQAWHLATSASTLRGRRGTWRHRPSLCVAGVALGVMDLHFAWQAWHLTTWISTLRGRRGTCGSGLALVARLVPSWHRPYTPPLSTSTHIACEHRC